MTIQVDKNPQFALKNVERNDINIERERKFEMQSVFSRDIQITMKPTGT